jgi:hypothetical protein
LGGPVEWRESSGDGIIYAASIHHVAGNKFMRDKLPYVVALIELTEGVRMMSNIINCEPAAATVGSKVKLAWADLPDGRALPMFELA